MDDHTRHCGLGAAPENQEEKRAELMTALSRLVGRRWAAATGGPAREEPGERIVLTAQGPLGEVLGRAVREDGRVVEVDEDPDPRARALIAALTARRERCRPSC